MIWTFLLLALEVLLERFLERPFLASLWGRSMARVLRGRRVSDDLYEVPILPAVGFRAAAQTWGETVLVIPELGASPEVAQILAHERCHVAQYRRLTSFGFWVTYLFAWLSGLLRYRNAFRAYWEIPLEVEARAAASAADNL